MVLASVEQNKGQPKLTKHVRPPPLPCRTIIFALCYFHAALLERKKFGVGNLPGATSGIGWNMNYPFNTGDLLCCGQTTVNYLENNVKVGRDRGGVGPGCLGQKEGGVCSCLFVVSAEETCIRVCSPAPFIS